MERKTVLILIYHKRSWQGAWDDYVPWCALFDVSMSNEGRASHMAIDGQNMSFVFLHFLLTFPEPVCWLGGEIILNPCATKHLFRVAGEGDTDFVTRCLFLGERFLLGPPLTPFATTKIPVLSACCPPCLRRGVAWLRMFFMTRPRP